MTERELLRRTADLAAGWVESVPARRVPASASISVSSWRTTPEDIERTAASLRQAAKSIASG